MKTFADVLGKGHTSRFERSLPDIFTNQLDMVLARRRFVEVKMFADIGIECPFFSSTAEFDLPFLARSNTHGRMLELRRQEMFFQIKLGTAAFEGNEDRDGSMEMEVL